MTVLVVDDQIHVVEGIVLGVRWDRLDVSKVFKAYNALEARAVMRDHRVDILLCDIEMPSESGLELLQWVREEKGETKCIFLTAHPEFEYALAAIRWPASLSGGNGKSTNFIPMAKHSLGKKRGCWQESSVRGFSGVKEI